MPKHKVRTREEWSAAPKALMECQAVDGALVAVILREILRLDHGGPRSARKSRRASSRR